MKASGLMLLVSNVLFAAMTTACADGIPSSNEELTGHSSNAGRELEADFLIYDGLGVDPTDTQALARIVELNGRSSRVIDERQLNGMSVEELSRYGVLVWPGGENRRMLPALSRTARLNVREAVREKGLSYVGICAGAFIAVGKLARDGVTPESGLAVLEGEYLENYVPADGVLERMITTLFPDGTRRELVLWSGPYFNFDDGVVARYAEDGKAAIVQKSVKDSLVILSGPHPEAPESFQVEGGFEDPDGLDWDIAWRLLDAALSRQSLPTMPLSENRSELATF